ncbi:rod-binding protein [Rhizobium sp. YIM 134829]|jgi:flagellar protein FlgJ|uniref:rod-binding protein n=1 Tax=Rhizobium sp. YIM 134829 TaxID=3390453 RepID=UPI00397A1F30
MAISPPSDLVLDVVRAADPARVEEAQARLKANQAAFRATSLAETGNGFSNTVAILDQNQGTSGLGNINNRAPQKAVPEAYRKFEAMVLQNFMKSMMPKDSEEVYGKGIAGNMWKDMMAEQMGTVLAKGRGIGIAEHLVTDRIDDPVAAGLVNPSLGGDDRNVARSMVEQYQRHTIADVMKTDEADLLSSDR